MLCVDDDVCLHPTTLRDTIAALREHPDIFMATGASRPCCVATLGQT